MWVEPSFSMTDAAKNPTRKNAEIAPKLLVVQSLKFLKIVVTVCRPMSRVGSWRPDEMADSAALIEPWLIPAQSRLMLEREELLTIAGV